MRYLLPFLALACAPVPDADVGIDSDVDDLGMCHEAAPLLSPPACGSGPLTRNAWIPGTGSPDHDADLAAKALRIERQFHGLAAWSTGVNTEVHIDLDNTAFREALTSFLDGDGWDFADATGVAPDSGASWGKAAGGYAGVGIAADAMRYGVLRDEGAPCDAVEQARNHLIEGLRTLHMAMAITGTPGVIARGFARTDHPGHGQDVTTVLLTDDVGEPQPFEKTNGTWRRDQSGNYPAYVWEDSCSRDMLMGWVTAMGFVWEVAAHDPTFPEGLIARLRADATALGRSLSTVQDSGYDLEIRDADGRMTYHGILHEESIDRTYTPGIYNGANAMMSLGAAATLAMVSGDQAINDWLNDELIAARDLPGIAERNAVTTDFGVITNFSNYNMNFLGGLTGVRYLCDDDARATLAQAVHTSQYDIPGKDRQPAEQGQTLYDLTATLARHGAWARGGSTIAVDATMLDLGMRTLRNWHDAPWYDLAVDICDGDDTPGVTCEAEDGTTFHSLGRAGRNDTWVAEEPVPIELRPPSNYVWRSNPYQLEGGGDGSTLLPSVDFRVAYWLGRWAQR